MAREAFVAANNTPNTDAWKSNRAPDSFALTPMITIVVA